MTSYLTVSSPSFAEYTEKRSRFIAGIFPCGSEPEAQRLINETRTRYWDARHNVYAYVLRENSVKRFSDDGEPHGTAGKPVLEVIEGAGICDALIVVTRYFGGVLLGTSGLVRAYGSAAKMALSAADIVEMRPCRLLKSICEYSDHERLARLISDYFGKIENSDFGEKVTLSYCLEEDIIPRFLESLSETFSARISADILGERLSAFKIKNL